MLEKLTATLQNATFRAVAPLRLPEYKGSTFRGALGYSFKQVACALRTNVCEECLLRYRCAYSVCFETPVPQETEIMRRYDKAPHPFVLEPPLDTRRDYEPGEELTVRLWLVGKAAEFLPHFVCAFDEMAREGLGKGRARAELVRLSTQNGGEQVTLYDNETKKLRGAPATYDWDLIRERTAVLRGKPVRLVFETPVRVKKDGDISGTAHLTDLFPALMRRLHTLGYFFCGADFPKDVGELLDAARSVTTRNSDLQWVDRIRYSARQDKKLLLSGFVGTVEYEDVPDILLPYLCWGEWLHMGKASAFGLGKYRIEDDKNANKG